MGLHTLALQLHKTIAEIETMSHLEYMNWIYYFEQKDQDMTQEENLLNNPDALLKGLVG